MHFRQFVGGFRQLETHLLQDMTRPLEGGGSFGWTLDLEKRQMIWFRSCQLWAHLELAQEGAGWSLARWTTMTTAGDPVRPRASFQRSVAAKNHKGRCQQAFDDPAPSQLLDVQQKRSGYGCQLLTDNLPCCLASQEMMSDTNTSLQQSCCVLEQQLMWPVTPCVPSYS